MKRIVALISGRGSNMQAILAASRREPFGGEIVAVVANRTEAQGLATAHSAGIATDVVDHRAFATREAFDSALAAAIDRHAPDLVVLAGFMRVLGAPFVDRYRARLVNIHPSLLPAFPGLHTHRQALAAGVTAHGCTVHFVTPALDHGPIIVQGVVPVQDDDDEDTLARRVLAVEHKVYPLAVRWFCEDRLVIDGAVVRVKGARPDERLVCARTEP